MYRRGSDAISRTVATARPSLSRLLVVALSALTVVLGAVPATAAADGALNGRAAFTTFRFNGDAVDDLEGAQRDDLVGGDAARALLDRLAGAGRLVAVQGIERAESEEGAKKVPGARKALADGDEDRAAGDYKQAVIKYRTALSKAETGEEGEDKEATTPLPSPAEGGALSG